MAAMLEAFAGALPELEQCVRTGGGLAPGAFAPHFASAGAEPGDTWRRVYDEQLVGGFLGAVPGLPARLGLGNAACVIVDAAARPARPRFDVIIAFDAVHDQRSPQVVLSRARAAPGRKWVACRRP